MKEGPVLALSGGVGGAKLCVGLSRVLPAQRLVMVCNTADDFDHLSLRICPDLDSVMYALAGLNDEERGWGRADEGWRFMESLRQLGGEDWFQLGDRDLATHVERSRRLAAGQPLSAVTTALCRALDIEHLVAPMSDQKVETRVTTPDGELHFQHYFVREQCRPTVSGFRFEGVERAEPGAAFRSALSHPDLAAVVLCPSNPFVSIDPILALPGIRRALREISAPVIAVSPIVGGEALKGPAAKMLRELGLEATATAVAEHYADSSLIDGFVLDRIDADLEAEIADAGVAVIATQTVMRSLNDRIALAEAVLAFAASLERTHRGQGGDDEDH